MGTNSIVPRSGIPVVTMPAVYTKIPLFPSSFYDLLIEITFQIFLYILTFGKLIFFSLRLVPWSSYTPLYSKRVVFQVRIDFPNHFALAPQCYF